MITTEFKHFSVLLNESINSLNINKNGIYIDSTFGNGGHSVLILSKLGKNGRLIAIDRDPESVKLGKKIIKDNRFFIKNALFSELENIVEEKNLIGKINGVLIDLGVSSLQLDDSKRGFSFMKDGPLDMRMNQNIGETASEWLIRSKEKDIFNVLKKYGEEKFAKRIAKEIYFYNHNCKQGPLKRTKELVNLIKKINPRRKYKNSSTRSFQAIRIHINNELEEIEKLLEGLLRILAINGRFCVITFHSLEDRVIKYFAKKKTRNQFFFKRVSKRYIKTRKNHDPYLRFLGKIKPTNSEIISNIRSRSAMLYIFEKIE